MLKEQIVHLPKPELRCSRLGNFRRSLRVWMNFDQRKMAVSKTEPLAEPGLQCLHDRVRSSAVWTFIVTKFNQHNWRFEPPLHVIPIAHRWEKRFHIQSHCRLHATSGAGRPKNRRPVSVSASHCSDALKRAAEYLRHATVERGKVIRFTAGDQITVDHQFLVYPLRPGIFEIGLE